MVKMKTIPKPKACQRASVVLTPVKKENCITTLDWPFQSPNDDSINATTFDDLLRLI